MTAAVVLAAGAGRRFGGAKQVATLDGEPLVRRACRIARDAGLDPVLVVVGAHAAAVTAAIADLPVRVVTNPGWPEGMGGSLACGVRAIADDPSVADVAVLLADQPRVTAAHLRALGAARARAGARVAATRAGAVVGAPAVFARAAFADLAALAGDRGARDVIAHSVDRIEVRFDDAALDVDTPADLA